MHRSVLPFVRKTLVGHPALLGAASAASGLLRQMSITPFTPRKRTREFLLKDSVASLHACRALIFKEKGAGSIPTVVVGGFVPDATEQVEFQRSLFREYGSIYYLNYPRHGFSSEMFFAQLADLIEDLNNRDQRPILFGVSFGCGLLARFLQQEGVPESLRIRGVVMTSPVLCTEDLIRPEHDKSGGVRMLESNLRRIIKAGPDGGEVLGRQIERARRCFQALFETGAQNRVLSSRHLSIKKKIMQVIETTPATGGYQRVLALEQFTRPDGARPIFTGPALTLLAEDEENLLVPSSPTLAMLNHPNQKNALFPRGVFRKVISLTPGDAVAHASLIFHHHCYNPIIRVWYDNLRPQLIAAV
jgi:pimeloyl-ACP methyl ester carboxylesterase